MKKIILLLSLYILMVFSVLSFLISFLVHIATYFNIDSEQYASNVYWLHYGIFIAWFPVCAIAYNLYRELKKNQCLSWSRILRSCPVWIKNVVSMLCIYGFTSIVVINIVTKQRNDIIMLRYFSSAWIMFYSVSVAVFYSKISDNKIKGPK
ncbi:hypothetical protein KAR91_87855 [Candidatus Pacearchaeota archaeon]|nr:hypothetical protein [Candidatus Pacearchaeota archaeon]